MLQIEVRRAEDFDAEEMAQLNEIWEKAFANEPRHDDIEWSSSEWRVVGREDGRIVSHVGLLEREGQVVAQHAAARHAAAAQRVRMGGVGGVATHPDFQRRGYAGQLLEAAAVFMRESMRLPFALLVCETYRIPFYGSHGWQPLATPMMIHQRGQIQPWDGPVMTLALGQDPWPEGVVDILGNPW